MADRFEWHGHHLAPLPPGERWLLGADRAASEPNSQTAADADSWILDLTQEHPEVAPPPAAVPSAPAAAHSHRGAILLVLLGISALITIIVAHHRGQPADPAPLPEPASTVVTALSRTSHQQLNVHVGDYITFQLPGKLTYSAVIEQPGAATPVLESLDLPGQQPQLRADSPGHAFVEVMQEPPCSNANGCPDQRTVSGGVDVTVTP